MDQVLLAETASNELNEECECSTTRTPLTLRPACEIVMFPHITLPKRGLYVVWLSPDRTHYYGGRAVYLARRLRSHLRDLKRGCHENIRMQRVFNKHKHFEFEILAEANSDGDLLSMEQVWLDEHFGKEGCVNLSSCSAGGSAGHTEATRLKMSTTRRTRPDLVASARTTLEANRPLRGACVSPQRLAKIRAAAAKRRGVPRPREQVEKTAAANRGRKNTVATIEQMSASAKARALAHPTVHSEATRILISEQQRGRVWVNDGTTNQRLFPEEAAHLLLDGWLPGRKPRPADKPYKNKGQPPTEAHLAAAKIAAEKRRGRKQSPEAIAKTSAANRGRKRSPEAVANMKEAGKLRQGVSRAPEVVTNMRNMAWVNKEGVVRRVSKDDLDALLADGWVRGRKSR